VTAVEDLAPYPETEEQATAEVFARHYAVRATTAYWAWQTAWHAWEATAADSPDRARLRDDWNQALLRSHHAFTIAYLLRALSDTAPVDADIAARAMYGSDQDGDAMEYLYEWLEEYGIDPQQMEPQEVPGCTPSSEQTPATTSTRTD
jgi:hypothetical protein